MRIFGRGPRAADYPVITGRCWADPQLDALHAAVHDPAHPPELRVRWVLDHLAAVRADPERRTITGRAVDAALAEHLDAVRAAADAPAPDPAAAADAQALLAAALVAAAWKVRGTGRGSTVSARAFRVFHEILDEADEVGHRALRLDPGHPLAAYTRLVSARGLGVPEEEWRVRFDVARRLRPTLYAAHTTMLQTLCKKWYGSHDLMFDFARRTAAEAPVGDPVGAVLAIAHIEYMGEEGRRRVPPEDLDLARHAADQWFRGGEQAMAAHPYAPEAHQLFAWMLLPDRQRCRYHLGRSGGRLSTLPWDYLEDGEKVYRQLMVEYKVPLPPHGG